MVTLVWKLLTWVRHGYRVVWVVGAHIVNDNCGCIATCSIADFLPKRTIPPSDQRHPGDVLGGDGEFYINVTSLSVPKEGR